MKVRTLVRLVASLVVAAASCVVAGGCEAIVGESVPAFTCVGKEPGSCPGDQICAPALGKCVGRSTACSVLDNCPAGKRCDPSTEACVDAAADAGGDATTRDASRGDSNSDAPSADGNPSDVTGDGADSSRCGSAGCVCTRNADCDTNLCADSGILTSAVTGKICTKPCCASEECGTDNVCFAAGTGGNYCVPKKVLNRNVTLGQSRGGTTCTLAAECRSGVCGVGNKCLDSCCTDTNCATGTQCTYNSETGHDVFQCAINAGLRTMDQACTSSAQCHGGICHDYGAIGRFCVSPCCTSAATGPCNVGTSGNACFDYKEGRDWISACLPPNTGDTIGPGKMGDLCNTKSDCKSVHCTAGKCTDVCCSDADCAAVSGWICQPTVAESGTFLRCGPVQ